MENACFFVCVWGGGQEVEFVSVCFTKCSQNRGPAKIPPDVLCTGRELRGCA